MKKMLLVLSLIVVAMFLFGCAELTPEEEFEKETGGEALAGQAYATDGCSNKAVSSCEQMDNGVKVGSKKGKSYTLRDSCKRGVAKTYTCEKSKKGTAVSICREGCPDKECNKKGTACEVQEGVIGREGDSCTVNSDCQEPLGCTDVCERSLSCVDSDNGENPADSIGTVTLIRSISGNITADDNCKDNSTVREFSCEESTRGAYWTPSFIPCSAGCVDGACVTEEEPVVEINETMADGQPAVNQTLQAVTNQSASGQPAVNQTLQAVTNQSASGQPVVNQTLQAVTNQSASGQPAVNQTSNNTNSS